MEQNTVPELKNDADETLNTQSAIEEQSDTQTQNEGLELPEPNLEPVHVSAPFPPKKQGGFSVKNFLLFLIPLLLVCGLIIAIVAAATLMPMYFYYYAESLADMGYYDEAIEMYEGLGFYGDAYLKIDDVKYRKVLSLIEAANYEEALILLDDELYNHEKYYELRECFVYQPVSEILKYEDGSNQNDYYLYDEKGRCTKHTRVSVDNTIEIFEYLYDSNNNCVSEVYTGNEEIISYEYLYDENGNLTNATEKFSDGFYYTTVYEYDTNNNLVFESCDDEYGDLFSNTTYSYDSYGNCLKEIITYFDGDVSTYSYKYDEYGNCTEALYECYDDTVEQYFYTYDEYGNCINGIVCEDGTEVFKMNYYYDDYGKKLSGEGYSTFDDYSQVIQIECDYKLFYYANAEDFMPQTAEDYL